MKSLRREICRTIFLDIQKKYDITKLGRKQYRSIARTLCYLYPGLLDKLEGDTLLGDGLGNVILNFENIDNLKRGEIPSRIEAKKRKIVTPHSKNAPTGALVMLLI